MKLYTHASPSHESLLQEFLLPSAVEFDEVVVGRCSQASVDQYGLPGWGENTYEKARTMRRAVYECEDLVVWADADVLFLAPAVERLIAELGDNDIAFQRNYGVWKFCTGLWIARCDNRVRRLFDVIVDMREYFERQGRDDQTAMNDVVGRSDVRTTFLSTSEFCTAGWQDGRWREWVPERDPVPLVPSTAIAFHANWCRGLESKRLLLEGVRSVCATRSRRGD
ncbi:MAG: putative nucleotide-diphospho-sugar transferase [Pirellulaceae bacterium]